MPPTLDYVNPTTLGGIETGERFVFNDLTAASPAYNDRYGPFVKVSRARYKCTDGTLMPITTTTYKVLRVIEPAA